MSSPGRTGGEPTRWRRAAYHAARAAILAVLAVGVAVLFPTAPRLAVTHYEEGMVAQEDVIAQLPFSVPKTPDELGRDRRVAMDLVSPTFDHVPEAADTMAAQLTRLFDLLDSAVASEDTTALEAALATIPLMVTPSQVRLLRDDDARTTLRSVALLATNEVLRSGVVDAGQALDITAPTIAVREAGGVERSVPVGEVVTTTQFLQDAQGRLPAGAAPDLQDLLRLILNRNLEFTLVFNVVATETDREAAARTVVTTKDDVLEGEAIVRQADPIGSYELERLQAYEDLLRTEGRLEERGFSPGAFAGHALVNLLLLLVFGLLVFFFRPEVYANLRWLLLQAILVGAYFGAGALIAGNDLPAAWLPIAFVALPVAVLWDARMALVLVLVLAVLTGTLPQFDAYSTVLVVAVAGAAAALSVRAVRRRSETWVSIAIIAAAAGLVLLGEGLASARDLSQVAPDALAAAGNATVSALLAMGFLWVFELFTGITTDQTLLEWADPTRPLLKRLSLEAPGTYAHTINVANLAEAAANAVGANGLLCRVGVYYHDVGKMLKPHYFVENQPDGRNPHDKLKPATSAAIVKEHVTEGVRLARDAGVPEVVQQFILEHHGTQKIGFFYEKAREEGGEGVDVERFSYPGPRPRSRETAIVMLADSCESATRAMKEPTPERVRDLIETIVQGKVAQGQLDDAPLTLREVTLVEDQFVKILSGVLHRRIEYPETKHLTDSGEGRGEDAAEAEPVEAPVAGGGEG